MEKLVILNYSTCEVHIYNVDSETNVDETYIRELGHKPSECSWMFAGDIEIIHHKGILK